MYLYLVRHGQSAGNVPGEKGGPNPDLSDIGYAQAEATGRALASTRIGAILASPLVRALRTAHLIAQPVGAKLEAWPDLAETDRSAWKLPKKEREAHFRGDTHGVALTARQVAELFPGTSVRGFSGDDRWWVDQRLEGRGRTCRRAAKVIRRIRKRWTGREEAVIVITHGAFGSVLLATLAEAAPADYNRFSQYNCGISLIEVQSDESRIRFLNRVDHLPAELRTDLT